VERYSGVGIPAVEAADEADQHEGEELLSVPGAGA